MCEMALSILSKYSHQLLSAFGSDIESVVSQFVSEKLISEEVSKEIQQSSEDKAKVLLNAIEKSIATDNNQFEIVLDVLNNVLLPRESNEGCGWVKEMEEEYLKPQERPRTSESPLRIPESESPELNVIQMFWRQLVTIVGSHVLELSDDCLSGGLITEEAYKKIHESSSMIATRRLLFSVRGAIRTDSSCYGRFLDVLMKIRGDQDLDNLLLEMDSEYFESNKPTSSPHASCDGTESMESEFPSDSVCPEVAVLRKFTRKLITAISDCILTVSDLCYTNGLIYASEQKHIVLSSKESEDKATRMLLVALRQNLEISKKKPSDLFHLFLSFLGMALPIHSRDKLLSEMKDYHKRLSSTSSASSAKATPRVRPIDLKIASAFQNMRDSLESIARCCMEKEDLEEQLIQKEEENQQLKSKLNAMEAEKCDTEEAKKEIAELRLKIKDRDIEIVQLKEKIVVKEKIIDMQKMEMKREQVIIQENSRDLAKKLEAAETANLEMKERIQSLEDLILNFIASIYNKQNVGPYYLFDF